MMRTVIMMIRTARILGMPVLSAVLPIMVLLVSLDLIPSDESESCFSGSMFVRHKRPCRSLYEAMQGKLSRERYSCNLPSTIRPSLYSVLSTVRRYTKCTEVLRIAREKGMGTDPSSKPRT
jgi:hypothetical protein